MKKNKHIINIIRTCSLLFIYFCYFLCVILYLNQYHIIAVIVLLIAFNTYIIRTLFSNKDEKDGKESSKINKVIIHNHLWINVCMLIIGSLIQITLWKYLFKTRLYYFDALLYAPYLWIIYYFLSFYIILNNKSNDKL